MNTKKILYLFIVLAIAYVGLTFAIPPEGTSLTARYQLSSTETQLLRVTFVLPIVVIWFIAFYGYHRFRQYVESVDGTPEGSQLSEISRGLLILALWLPLGAVIGSVTSYVYYKDPDLTASMIILKNYVNLALVLYAFYVVNKGAIGLLKVVKKQVTSPINNAAMALLVIASSLFAYLTLVNPARQFPTGKAQLAAYYLPDALIILTVIIPYIMVFYLGLSAVLALHLYKKTVKGILYRKALSHLANGIGVVVISLMLIRYLTAMTTLFSSANLKLILLVVYVLLFLIATGYVLIAAGAKRLQRIEEI